MPEETGNIEATRFGVGIPVEGQLFYLKGSNELGWGMKDRLSRVFNPKSGRTVMLAFDHGYILGPTAGLERMDLTIVPLIEYADCIMCTRGALRQVVPPTANTPISLRVSAGSTVLTELNEEVIMDVEEAIRLNASMMAAMVSVGGKFEALTVSNLTKLVDMGSKYGIPVMGVTAVGKELTRDARYLAMASRVCAENGAHVVKTYFCEEGFEKVVAACPVPIVIAGGKKLPELDALKMAHTAMNMGALGVDMGRNIFQADAPAAMIKAVRAVVHDNETPEQAYQMYQDLQSE